MVVPKGNEILRWPIVLAVGLPLLLIVLRTTPIAPNFLYVLIGQPLLLFMWTAAGVAALGLAVVAAADRRWIDGALAAVLPLTVLLADLHPLAFIHQVNSFGDVIHFQFMRPFYLQRTNALPASKEPRLLVFNWGGDIEISIGVVYDESDEVMIARDHQTESWKRRVGQSELSCDGYTVQPMGGHFYLAEFRC